uniref:Uncharacterized protein n=1 Tax=viral metagenome TaxID=1070528 RepID=A0A6C0JFF4_9ZZZZ
MNNKNTNWNDETEKILIDLADQAMCYNWMHNEAHADYSKKAALFTIPTIILSISSGTINFSSSRIEENYREYLFLCIGIVNIITGLLIVLQEACKIHSKNESHRIATISWDKLYRNTKIELAKPPNMRIPAINMVNIVQNEFNKLIEVSPVLGKGVINRFNKTFPNKINKLNDKNRAYLAITKPEICNVLVSVSKSVYNTKKILDKEVNDKIGGIIKKFKIVSGRNPTPSEIIIEADNAIEIEIVEKYLRERNVSDEDMSINNYSNYVEDFSDDIFAQNAIIYDESDYE